jgi:uncharacterized protein YcgI (DUF1989 family)
MKREHPAMSTANESAKPLSIAGTRGSPLRLGERERAAYAELAKRPRKHLETIDIPARTGKAFVVEQGQILRVTCNEGPQVADFNAFGREDRREKFWSARTRIIGGSHLSAGDQLWSAPPRTRPMLTIVTDTVEKPPLPHGARTHDLIFTRCDRRHYELIFKESDHPSCQQNLASAVAPFGLTEYDVHDPLNLFMTTGLNDEGRPFYLPSVARRDDFVELFADIGCIIAISACPGGSSGQKHLPLRADIFAVP